MKKVLIAVFLLMFSSSAYANCAIEKKPEFDKLLAELKTLDQEMAQEARRAFGLVSTYEAFDDKSPQCAHIDNLLENMRDMIDNYKN